MNTSYIERCEKKELKLVTDYYALTSDKLGGWQIKDKNTECKEKG